MAAQSVSGIYEIVNLVNGKRYIGSAVDFKRRWYDHSHQLRRGDHHNIALQRAWNMYGETQFRFSIIELCPADCLIKQEQVALDTLKPEYNICRKAGSTLGVRPSDETRAKLSARLVGNTYTRGMKFSPEICARMGTGKIGLKYPPRSEEHCRKLSESNKGHKRCVGRILSEETKEKIRQANLGKRKTVEVRLKRCTLNEGQVRDIRSRRANGSTYKEIAIVVGIRQQLVGKICRRERYEWIDPSEPIAIVDRKRGWKYSAQGLANRSAATKASWARRKAASSKP